MCKSNYSSLLDGTTTLRSTILHCAAQMYDAYDDERTPARVVYAELRRGGRPLSDDVTFGKRP